MSTDSQKPTRPSTPSAPSKVGPRLISGAFGGALAGTAALLLDHLLAYLVNGIPLPSSGLDIWIAYLSVGLAVGAVSGPWASGGIVSPACAAFAVIYSLPIAERLLAFGGGKIERSLLAGMSWQKMALFGTSILAALLLTGVAAFWLVRRSGNVRLGMILTGLAAATGLAVNRGAFQHPLETPALVADGIIVLSVIGAAELYRRAGAKSIAALTTAVLVIAVVRAVHPSASAPESGSNPTKPHLILLVVDTLRADVFERVVRETPEGRAFAEHFDDAAWFSRAQATSPWTAPSMGSILTGLYPAEHGFGAVNAKRDLNRTLRPMSQAAIPLTTRLANRGYATEAILANPILFPGCGLDRDFDRYEILTSNIKRLPLAFAIARLGGLEIHAYQDAAEVNRHLEKQIARWSRSSQPLFLWLHYLDPHKPMRLHPGLPEDPLAAGLDAEQRIYRDETRFALLHVSRAIERLKQASLWQNSTVVFVSDHGELMYSDQHVAPVNDKDGQPLRRGHGKVLYQGLTHIPLIVKPAGGLDEKREIDALVSHADIYDTLVDLLELDTPKVGGDRISLAPWLRGSRPDSPRSATLLGGIQAGIPQKGLVTDTHKLIVYQRQKPPELYELSSDPGELEDLNGRIDPAPWLEELDVRWAELVPRQDEAAKELDQETRDQLKALGYLQ